MDSFKDFELIEKAEFTPAVKLFAIAAVSSLQYLKSLSGKLGVPIEQITAAHIIHEFSEQDAKNREHIQEFAAFLARKDVN